jgi:hypothetical protein
MSQYLDEGRYLSRYCLEYSPERWLCTSRAFENLDRIKGLRFRSSSPTAPPSVELDSRVDFVRPALHGDPAPGPSSRRTVACGRLAYPAAMPRLDLRWTAAVALVLLTVAVSWHAIGSHLEARIAMSMLESGTCRKV